MLEATGLRKEFGEVVAVDGVDLQVAPGGSLAIVGESGSGKTTVARMLVGLERADRGDDHRLRQRPLARPRGRRRSAARRGSEVQIVFQDPYSSLDPRHSAEQAIDEVLRLHSGGSRGRARDPRAPSWATLVGLDGRQLPRAARARCPAASASGWRSPARWRPSRAC